MRAKFQKGDRVSMADEMPQVDIDRGVYERDDVLTVLTTREHRLDDGAKVHTYLVSGGRWFYEHNLKSAVLEGVREVTGAITLVSSEQPAISISGPGVYRTRSGQTAYVLARVDHAVWPWEGEIMRGEQLRPRREKWRECGHSIDPKALDAADLVERLGDL